MDEEKEDQQKLHEILEQLLDLEDGEVLSGWIVIHETARLDNERSSCGHFYGPRGMTTWRALGLVEWVRRFSLKPDEE